MAGLQAADELEVNSKTVAVVEADSKQVTLHVEGKNRTFTAADMPASLAITLAERWFDPRLPANKLYLGAFHAIDPKGDLVTAKKLWNAATKFGASADDVMPLLDQMPKRVAAPTRANVAASGPAKPPSDNEVAQARRAVRSKYQRDILASKSPDDKV